MKLERPPYILLHAGDAAGCGHHRMTRPLEIMSKMGVAAGQNKYQFLPPDLLKALNPDIVVWQRQGEDHQIEVMKQYREALPKAFFVYELDDAMSSVPEKSWHRPYMPPNVNRGLVNGALICDAMTVSTRDLALHMKTLCREAGREMDIRIAPNMLSLEDFENAFRARAAAKQARKRDKFRIGWGGGAGHGGDFDQLQEAFKHFGKKIEWIFLGFKPELPDGVDAIFAGAVTPDKYTAALANLDCDLMVAPLEDNHFNRCKSNLRLLEAGACLYPVIASPVTPYQENAPPVVQYAMQPSEWVDAIEKFMALPESQRADHARKIHNWARNHYCLDNKIEERLEYWLPKSIKSFTPHRNVNRPDNIVVVSEDPGLKIDGNFVRVSTLEEACRKYRGDVLFLRKGMKPPADLLERLNGKMPLQAASMSLLANDGGHMAFPKASTFTGIDMLTAANIDNAANELEKNGDFNAPISVGYASGPALLISRIALDMIGLPDFEIANPEISIIEWSAVAAARGMSNLGYFGAYIFCGVQSNITSAMLQPIAMRMGMRWPQPNVDVKALTEAREKVEFHFHRLYYRGLPPTTRNDYALWANLYDTPSKKDLEEMNEWMSGRAPLKVAKALYSSNASYFDALKDYSLLPDFDWIICADESTIIEDHFLAHLSKAIEDNPDACVVYSDHDRLTDNKTNPSLGLKIRADHEFKTDFDHHLFLGRDYITPIMAVKRLAIAELLNDEMTVLSNDCLAYDLVFRTIEKYGRESIAHIERVCAHLTTLDVNRLRDNAKIKAALADAHVKRLGWNVQVAPHPALLDAAEVRYVLEGNEDLVSIIIPTKNKVEMLAPCIATVLSMTNYQNFEILIIDNGSTRQEMLDYQASLTDPRIRVIKWAEPYNWSKLNNFAVKEAKGDVICFLNDDTRVLAHNWLTEMVAALRVPGVATVGARLLYPHQAVQHIGVVCSQGNNGHIHKGMPAQMPGYHGIAFLSHESSCVTGACMVTSRKIFDEIGGFPEYLSHNYNDVVFCLDAIRKGYLNVVAIRAELQHFEGVTRPAVNSEIGTTKLREEGEEIGKRYPEKGTYWNQNIAMFAVGGGGLLAGFNFDLFQWPALPWPWRKENSPFTRLLSIGSARAAQEELRHGDSIYEANLNGYEVNIQNPPLDNCKSFDIRDVSRAKAAFEKLGIDRIVLGSISDAPPVQLAFLSSIGLPIEYRPSHAESMCPRHTLRPNGELCNRGWASGECQACIDNHGSPHGPVSIMGWLAEWFRFFTAPNVTVNLENIELAEYATAIQEVFSGAAFEAMAQKEIEKKQQAQ